MALHAPQPRRAFNGLSMSLVRRAVATPTSATFIVITFIICIVLVLLQIFIFFTDSAWNDVADTALDAALIPYVYYSYRTAAPGMQNLLLCYQVPQFAGDTSVNMPCNITIPIPDSTGNGGPTRRFPTVSWRRWAATGSTQLDYSTSFTAAGDVDTVTVSSPSDPSQSIDLSFSCVESLLYVSQRTTRATREDGALIAFQLWLLSLSAFAIFYESVPHIYASLLSRLLITCWSLFSLVRVRVEDKLYQTLYRGPLSPCNTDLFDPYLRIRLGLISTQFAINTLFAVVLLVLGYRLSRVYLQQTFRHVGPPPGIAKIYCNFMAVQVCIQLGVYMLAVASGLFLDRLLNGAIATYSALRPLYITLCIGTIVFFIPYLFSGWYGIRYENRKLMIIFLTCVSILIISWAIVFYAEVFRLTFIDFIFFACIMVLAFLILILCLVFGSIGITQFDKGLLPFLRLDDNLAKAGVIPDVFTVERDAASVFDKTPYVDTESLHAPRTPRAYSPDSDPVSLANRPPLTPGSAGSNPLPPMSSFMRGNFDPFARDSPVLGLEEDDQQSVDLPRRSIEHAHRMHEEV